MATQIDGIDGQKIGNTNQSSVSKKVQLSQRKNWFFTFNSYLDGDILTVKNRLDLICSKYVFQEEVGESGNPHLQGTIILKKPMRWTEINLSNKIHWEATKNVEASFDYCSKSETKKLNGIRHSKGLPYELKLINVLKPWQQTFINHISKDPDDRTVNWIYDKDGNIGKTILARYAAAKYDAIVASAGSAKDIACLLAILKKGGRDLNAPTTFIFDFPRSNEGYYSYQAIESVKNGLITSSKYESSTILFNPPHLWVFCNELPEMDKLSRDRWAIWTVIEDQLVKYN